MRTGAIPGLLRASPDTLGVWVAGVGLVLLLGVLSSTARSWAAPIAVLAVLAVGAYFVRILSLEAGLVVLLIVANAADHFTFRLGSLDLRAEQVAALAALAALAATRLIKRDYALLRLNLPEALLLAWLACAALGTALDSPDRRLGAKILVLIAICTLGFSLPRRLLSGPRAAQQLEVVIRWLLIAFATESAYGTLAYLLHLFGPTVSIGANPATGHLDAYGTLWEQNVFGAFAAAGGVAWVYLGPGRFKRPWIGLALCIGGLVDSLTRAAWLAAGLVGAAGIAIKGLRRHIDMSVVGVGVITGALIAGAGLVADQLGSYTVPVTGSGAPPQHHGFISAIFNVTDFVGRINQVGPVLGDIHGRYAVLGRGIGSYETLHVVAGVPQHVADLPLLVLNDTGVVGLAIFTAFMVAVGFRAWQHRANDIVLGLSQVAILVLLANLATQTTELMIGWLLIGILMAAVDVAIVAETHAAVPKESAQGKAA